MSGVFMDGGGGGQTGHGVQVGSGGDSFVNHHHDHSTFVDSSYLDGSQPGHHGAPGHHAGAGEGGGGDGFLSNLLGYNQHTGQHGFLSHLLGLDHDHGSHGHTDHASLMADGAPQHGHAPSQGAIWNSALQHVNLGHLFEGFQITPNFWFMMMYIVFIAWLFLVYYIRRHEPFANAVLGKAPAAMNAADRRVISGATAAVPIKTSPLSNSWYVPNPGSSNMPSSMVRTDLMPAAAASGNLYPVPTSDAAAVFPGRANLTPAPMPSPLAALPTNNQSRALPSGNLVPPPPPMTPPIQAYPSYSDPTNPAPSASSYDPQAVSAPQTVPMQSDVSAPVQIYNVPIAGSARVRMCVNR